MAFSYHPTLDRPLDLVRFCLGDTAEDSYLVQDEEILAVLALQSTPTFAAAALADMIAGKFAVNASFKNLSLEVDSSDRFKHYTKLADRLRNQKGDLPGGDGAGLVLAEMYVGGSDRSKKQSLKDDTSLVQPTFERGIDDGVGNRTPDTVTEYGDG